MLRMFRPIPLAISVSLCLALYTMAGFVLVPYLIKSHVIPAVSMKLQRPILIKEAEFNPFLLSLKLTGLEIQERDRTALIGFDELFVDFESSSLIRQAYVFDTIRFTIPFVSIKVARNGQTNLHDIFPPSDPPMAAPADTTEQSKDAIPAIQIGRFEINQGIVEFRDESNPKSFSVDIVPINLGLNNFHTKPGGDNTYSFTAELGKGELLDWKGTISIEPIRSEGQLSLDGVKIATFFQYVQHQFRFDIPTGVIKARGTYKFDAATAPIDLVVSDASVHLIDAAVAEKDDLNPVITIPTINADGIQVDLKQRRVGVGSVSVVNATDQIWRNPDGTLNLQELFTPPSHELSPEPTPASSVSTNTTEKPWSVTIKNVSVKNHTIHFEDRTTELPMRADVVMESVDTHDLTLPDIKVIPLTVKQTLNGSGTIGLEGQMLVKPFQADFLIGAKHLELPPFQPYLDQPTRVSLDSGSVDLDGAFHLAMKHGKAPRMTFHGNLALSNLAVSNRDDASKLISLKRLQFRQVALAIDPTAVSIDEIGLDQPQVHIVVHEDGATNLSQLSAKSGEDATAPIRESPQTGGKSASPQVEVKTLKLLKGAATYEDHSIQPHVQTGIQDLTGMVKGLSSKQIAKADVDLSGKVDNAAPMKITGQINPLTEDAFTNLFLRLDNANLIAVSSYSGKYAGYPIKKGKLFLDLAYKVSQKQLEAENKIAIDQLTFGEKTNSPDAVALPVPLAVALLKDRKGRIDIDLPIRGDLKDPDFKYGRVVWSTLLNLLTKLVASPFTLLGKLMPGGGEGEELQFVAFEPGSDSLRNSESKKLAALAAGLEERPGLRLAVTGSADPARDRKALAYRQLQAGLLAKWRQEQNAPEETSVPPDQEARLVKAMYEQQFGRSAVTPPPVSAGEPRVTPSPSSVEDMKQQLITAMPSDEAGLRNLARQRADVVRRLLIGDGKLPEDRLLMNEVNLTASGQEMVRTTLSVLAEP